MAKLWYNRKMGKVLSLVTQKGGSMAKQITEHLSVRNYAKRGFLFLSAFMVSAVVLSSFYQPTAPEPETVAPTSAHTARQAAPESPQSTNITTHDTSLFSPRLADIAPAPVVAEQPVPTAAKIKKADSKPESEAAPPVKTMQTEPAQPLDDVPEEQEPEAQAAEPDKFVYSDKIPMSYELQEYTYQKCVERGLEYELVLAVMWRESRFKPDAVNVNANGTQDSGIMQINDVNRGWLSERWGIEDLMDPYQNIDAGTAMLGGLQDKYGSHRAMLAYQYGEAGMARKLANGVTTSTAIEKAYRQREVYKELLAG